MSRKTDATKIFEAIGNHKGYDYAVTLSSYGFRNGYVKIPVSIPENVIRSIAVCGTIVTWFGIPAEDIPNMYTNYPPCDSGFRWIGFYTTTRDVDEVMNVFGIELSNIFDDETSMIRHTQYFVDECKRFIDVITNEENK